MAVAAMAVVAVTAVVAPMRAVERMAARDAELMAAAHAAELPAVRVTAERRGADMALLAADIVAADAVVVLAAAAMLAAALAAAVTWVEAAATAVAAAVTGKFFFGSSPKSPSASADGLFFVGLKWNGAG